MTDLNRPTRADRFEDRLLQQLLDEWPHQAAPEPARRPAPRRTLLFGAGALAAAVAIAVAGILVVNAGNPAYAIGAQPNGDFVVVLYNTDAADLAKVEKALQQRGVRIELVSDHRCLDLLDLPTLPYLPHPPPTEKDRPELYAFWPATGAGSAHRDPITGDPLGDRDRAFIVRPDLIPPDQVLWVALAGADTETATMISSAAFAPVGAPPPAPCTDR